MNQVLEEMRAILEGAARLDELYHYGTPRHSGRYPWGSGDNPYQHSGDFLARVDELRKAKGFTYVDDNGKSWTGDTAIAKSMGLTSSQFRSEIALARDERRAIDVERAKSLKSDGLSTTEIGRMMGVNESTVRSWLNADSEARMAQAKETANFIREQINKKGMIDVGTGVERELNVSKEKLDQALHILEMEGYPIYKGGIPQATNPGKQTNQKVICPPGTEHKEIYNFDKVHSLKDYITRDDGETFEKKFHYPESMDSKRLMIRYKEDGGIEKDGVVELRRNVPDLSLGESRYSQVRILVDGTHYIKGMAVYSDDMPDGVDVIFNTNKPTGTPMTKVLKEIKKDPDNPFGSAIKDADKGGQYWYTDPKTGKRKLGLINKRADEGDWSEWKDALPSQFLSKQSVPMAKKQLGIAKADKYAEFEEICSLTNPTVKKHLLEKFADSCDSAAVHLQAAALPGQKYHVILPFPTMKETEVYAPNYKDGTKLALIRYPHGGTFEIPILTVNNKHPVAKKLLGTDVGDAVGINSKVAERLSGADFDGDTVMCIPTHDSSGKVKIASTPPLKGLEGFDPKARYGADSIVKDADGTEHYYRGGREFRPMRNTQTEMGVISNLINDMTLSGGATDEEKAKAVRHSMVVIDAEKHHLDYKQSERDNDIAYLKKKYQNGGGASTIISRAKSETSVPKRQGSPIIDPETGKKSYKLADDLEYQVTKVNKRTGEVTTVTKQRQQKSTKMAETDDAYTLVSEARHPMELVYAEYANSMKSLGNQARKEMMATGKIKYDAKVKATYQAEHDSLMAKLNTALLNAPKERQAQRMSNAIVDAKVEANPDMSKGDKKKASQRALSSARSTVGSVSRRDRNIPITDREWEAIQAGAISETKLKRILDNTDIDKLRERAMPKATTQLSQAKVNRIKAMSASYTIKEIADKFGLSPSTVSKYLKGVN